MLHGGLPQHGQKGGVGWEVETKNQYALQALRSAHQWQAARTFEGESGQQACSDRTSSPQGQQGAWDAEKWHLGQVHDLHGAYIKAEEEEGEEARLLHHPELLKIQEGDRHCEGLPIKGGIRSFQGLTDTASSWI